MTVRLSNVETECPLGSHPRGSVTNHIPLSFDHVRARVVGERTSHAPIARHSDRACHRRVRRSAKKQDLRGPQPQYILCRSGTAGQTALLEPVYYRIDLPQTAQTGRGDQPSEGTVARR